MYRYLLVHTRAYFNFETDNGYYTVPGVCDHHEGIDRPPVDNMVHVNFMTVTVQTAKHQIMENLDIISGTPLHRLVRAYRILVKERKRMKITTMEVMKINHPEKLEYKGNNRNK
jgi:hypothetical protein